MTLRNSIFAVSGAASFLDARRDMAGLFECDSDGNPIAGILDAPDTLVSGVSSGMKVTVAPFQAVLSRYGALLISNDGTYTVSLSAAPSANSRIDAVYVKQNEKDSPMSDASDGPVISVVSGQAAATPQAPTIPSGALLLAYVTIPAGVSNTTASGVVISQQFSKAAVKGGVPAVRTLTDLNALNMRDYSTVKVLADNVEYVRKDNSWLATSYSVNADFANGKLCVRCNRHTGMVRIVGCKIPTANSWAYVGRENAIPVQFRPTVEVAVPVVIENTTALVPRMLMISENGEVRIQNRGGGNIDTSNNIQCTAVWPVMNL